MFRSSRFSLGVAGLVLLGAVLQSWSKLPTDRALAGALLAGLVALLTTAWRKPAGAEEPEAEVPAQDVEQTDLELREKFRRLQDAYRALETSSRRDRVAVELFETRIGPPTGFADRLARRIATITRSRSATLYSVSTVGGSLVRCGGYGDNAPEPGETELLISQPMNPELTPEDALQTLREAGSNRAGIPISLEGKVVGLVEVEGISPTRCEEARLHVEDMQAEIAQLLTEFQQKEDLVRRSGEAELLYELRGVREGAESRLAVAERFVRELSEILPTENIGVFLLDQSKPIPLARVGNSLLLIEDLSFAAGPGIEGWIQIGSPELLMHDVRQDGRCPQEAALKARIGSYLLVPISNDGLTQGFVAAARPAAGLLGYKAAETLRLAAVELAHALFPSATRGLMTPTEFHKFASEQDGVLAQFQVLRVEALEASFGKVGMSHAMRQFSQRLRARLPESAGMCRRPQGEFLAFIPKLTPSQAESWVNEVVAYSSMIDLRTPDGNRRIPLSLRGKVAGTRSKNQRNEPVFG